MPFSSRRPALALSATALSAVLLTACGGGDSPSVSAPSDSASSTPQSTSAPTETGSSDTPSETPSESPSSPAETPSAPATSDAPPPSGKNVIIGKNKKFQITMPAGWADVQKQAESVVTPEQSKLIMVAIGDKKRNNTTNINVASLDIPGLSSTKSAAEQGAAKNKASGDSTVKMEPERTVAGEKGYGYTMAKKGSQQTQTQIYLPHEGAVYIITLTAQKKDLPAANKALDSFITSWTWK